MTAQFNPNGNSAGLSEPVVYAAIAIVLLFAVSIVLEKVGVASAILHWGAFATVVLTMVIAANAVWPVRLSSYAVAARRAPPAMIASGQIAAIAPSAFASALWAGGEVSNATVLLVLAGAGAGLWISALLFGAAMNRSGAYSLPQLLGARFNSIPARMLAVAIVAVPTFLLICGQVIAFGTLAEYRFGIPANAGMVASIAVMALLVWLPGIRGVLIAGAISLAGMLIAFVCLYSLLDFDFLRSVAPLFAEPRLMAESAADALPFLREAGISGDSRTQALAFVVAMAGAVAILPITTLFHPMAAKGSRTLNTAVTVSVALVAILAVAYLVVPSGKALSAATLPELSGGRILIDLAASALLHAMIATGAVHMAGFAGLLSFVGYHGVLSRQASENSRLIAARATVPLTAAATGWVVLTWSHAALAPAVPALLAAGAGVFPATVAAIFWRRCSAMAASVGMLGGASVVISVWLARQGVIDPTVLISGPSPVLTFMLNLTLAQSAVTGMAVATIAIIALSYLPHKSAEMSKPFFEAIREDRHRRLLNETVL